MMVCDSLQSTYTPARARRDRKARQVPDFPRRSWQPTSRSSRAHIDYTDIAYQLRNDPDFALQADAAHEYFVDLLHMRAAQRAIEGDCEPVFWHGIEVGHIRKFDSRLQIEMLRAHMPERFKTPGTGPINIDTGDKILVLTEEARGKLMEANRQRIMALPDTIEAEFMRLEDTPAADSEAQRNHNPNGSQ